MMSLLACEGAGNEATQGAEEARTSSATHKVQLTQEQAKQLEQRGVHAELIGDYGSFKVMQVDEKALATLPEGAQQRDDFNQILLNAGVIDTASQHGQSLRGMKQQASGKRFHIVQFAGPIKPEWVADLESTGAKVVTYIPNNAYIVYGDTDAMTGLQRQVTTNAAIQWNGEYLDDYKLNPAINTVQTETYAIQLIKDDEVNGPTLELIRNLQSRNGTIQEALGYVNVVAYLTVKDLYEIAARPDVLAIMPRPTPKKLDERQDMIISGNLTGNTPKGPGYLAWLASKGFTQAAFTASGFGVDVSDSGVDNGTQTPNHFGLYVGGDVTNPSRVVYNRLEGTPNSGSTIQGCDGHGNLNTHIVGGYSNKTAAPFTDATGFTHGLGVAPFVKVGSSVVFDPGTFTNPVYADLQSRAYRDGMRISTNSWGASSNLYDTDAQQYDALVRDAQPSGSAVPNAGNQEMVIVFAAGNGGSSANTVGTPGTAKNIITVGASENVRAFGAADLCGIADTGADSANDIISFSSRGPASDGRKKPEIVAPGTHVSGGVGQVDTQRSNTPANPNGQALSCFDASGVCGGPGNNFYPVGQQWYTASSGTSHSTPAVAGGAALVRQYFINQSIAPPSAAMTKAYLMNSAHYMTGVGANDNLWSNSQGMGLMDLGMAFDGIPRMLDDQNPANLFTATGQTRTFTGVIADSTKPFRVTMAWTDAPGATSGSAWKNNLDLTVTVGANTYKGNVFTGANSVTGGTADASNNAESVFLPAGATGAYTVTVTAANINSDGVPGNASALDQDFALVAYNSCTAAAPTPTGASAAPNGNNQIDVSWTENGSTAYNIYRSTTAGGPYTRVGTAAASPYSDKGVSGGTTYYYVVRAVQCAESPNSNETSTTATGLCTLPPTFAGLSSAANGAQSTCTNTLTWAAATPICGGTLSYSVYRGTTPGFTPSIANKIATGLTGTSFNDDLNLNNNSPYYYVVRATETSNATNEDTNTVQKSATPTGAITPGVNYFDDFDGNRPASASSYWIPTTQSGTTGTINLTTGCHYQSASTAYRWGAAATTCGGIYPNSVQATLSLGGNGTVAGINGFSLPATANNNPSMTFNLWYTVENLYDGAWLVYSTTGSTGPWTLVPDSVSTTAPYITAGGYDGTLNSSSTTRIWTNANAGANGSLKAVTVNLTPVLGQKVWFGFKFYSDSIINKEGVYIDDVRIVAQTYQTCSTNTPPPGPAVAYKLAGMPTTVGAGDPVTLTLTALDSVGQTATSYNGTATITSTDTQAQLPASVAFTSGVASGVGLSFRTLGSQSVTVTDTADTAITASASTTVTPGAPAALRFVTQPANAKAGNTFSPAVGLTDQFGNAITTGTNIITIALGNNPGGGTLSGVTDASAVNGVATFNLSLDKVGVGYTVVASSQGLTSATSAGFNITPGAPAKLAFLTQPSSARAGAAINPAVQVILLDKFGNTTDGTDNVSVGVNVNPGNDRLSGTLTVPAVNGVATFSDLSLQKVAVGYTIEASANALTNVTSSPFDISPANPHHVIITSQPSSVVAGATITPAVQVTILDQFGNVATQATNRVSASLGNNPTGASLAGAISTNAVNGVASFSNLSVDRAGLNYNLVVGGSGLFSATSVGFDVNVGAAAQLVFTSSPVGNVGSNSPFTVKVAVRDASGNLVTDASAPVTLSLGNAQGATLSGTLVATPVNGEATFADLSVNRPGKGYTLQASAAALTGATSPAFNIIPGHTPKLVFRTIQSQVAAGEKLTSIEVELQDESGVVLTDYTDTVTLSLGDNAAGGQLFGKLSAAAVNGVAKFDSLSLQKAGNAYTLVASAQGFTSAASAAFNVAPGAPASYAMSLVPSVTAGQEASLSVKAYDAYGNLASNYGGTVKVTSSDATASYSANAQFVEGVLQGFKVTFKSPGLRSITLTDADKATLTSTVELNVTPFAQPTVAVTDPAGGTTVTGKVNISAKGAVAPGNTLAKLSILVDGVEIASGSDETVTGTWDSAKAQSGSHIITAVVTDGAGNVAASAPVVVSIDGGCGCGATSNTEAGVYFGLLVLAWYGLGRRRAKAA